MRTKVKTFYTCWILSLLSVASLSAASDLRLVDAVKDGDKADVQFLLKQHADVNSPQADGATALHWAASRDELETVELLIQAGANVNAANNYGVTPLSLACTNGNAAMVEKLLKAGSVPNAALWTGETPLMTCARTGTVEAVKLLLAHGAKVNAKESERGQTALMWAVAQKHPEVVQALVEHGADIHARSATLPLYTPSFAVTYSPIAYFPKSKGGFTPLMFAAQAGDMDSARILLAAGAGVNEATPEDGSALIQATINGHEKVTLFLLEKGADPNVTDGYGLTALHWAVQEGIKALSTGHDSNDRYWEHPNMPELVKALLVHGANPNARIKKDFMPYEIHRYGRSLGIYLPQVALAGATPFLLAAATADLGTMRILLEGKADPKVATVEGVTPLMVAAGVGPNFGASTSGGGVEQRLKPDLTEAQEKKFLEIAKLAIGLGNDVNAVGPGGRTALHGATFHGLTPIIQLLVENGADLEAQDMYGETPMSIALGDPGQLVWRQFPAGDYDLAFRSPKADKKVQELLLKLGAKPYTGPVADRRGQ